MNQAPGSIRCVDPEELNKRVECIYPNPKVREEFDTNIRILVSVLNADNVSGETAAMVNEKIQRLISNYYNPVLIIKEI
jgi:hypothetical protein